jgi:hypothetical protein
MSRGARHTPRVARGRLIAMLAGCLTVLCVAAAHAQDQPEPGVHIDPDSPSAKEYGIPLEDARRDASPARARSAASGQGMAAAPLFGLGVTARPRGAKAGSARRGARRGQKGSPPASSTPSAGGPEVVAQVGRPGALPGGGGSAGLLIGVAALVLGLGVAAGLVLRLRNGR